MAPSSGASGADHRRGSRSGRTGWPILPARVFRRTRSPVREWLRSVAEPARRSRRNAAPAGIFLVASLAGEPLGCGALKFHGDGPAELKRMWVAPSARGLGVGRRVLAELEARAAAHGSRAIRLETNATLTEAIAMYRSTGYREVDRFNDERYADHWFEKRVSGTDRER